jgi:lantibiotic modifying enzyme
MKPNHDTVITSTGDVLSATATDLIATATALGERLLETATRQGGQITWNGGYNVRFELVADAGIFSGRIGEALFLSALFAATSDERYADATRLACAGLIQTLGDLEQRESLSREIGLGLTGVGSIVYALVRIGGFLGEDLLSSARLAADALTDRAIANDRVHDVFWGKAGAILGLLSLASSGDDRAISQAIRCGDLLLDQRVRDPETGLRAWATLEPEPWAGFAHGSSGIGTALLRLSYATGERAYADAALESFAFERSLFIAETSDWPDSRSTSAAHKVMNSWCHGAAGIALSRLCAIDALSSDDDALVINDLDLALTRTCEQEESPLDNVCCGNLGRAEITLEAGLVLDNDSLVRQANQIASTSLARARARGRFGIPGDGDGPQFRPGLWQGLAGIGYVMLRLSDPKRFPCLVSMS